MGYIRAHFISKVLLLKNATYNTVYMFTLSTRKTFSVDVFLFIDFVLSPDVIIQVTLVSENIIAQVTLYWFCLYMLSHYVPLQAAWMKTFVTIRAGRLSIWKKSLHELVEFSVLLIDSMFQPQMIF